MVQYKEQRQHPRYTVNLRVFIGTKVEEEPDTTADLIDISVGGAKLICRITLRANQPIVIEFPPSLTVGNSVVVQPRRRGRVRWTNTENGQIGVQFEEEE